MNTNPWEVSESEYQKNVQLFNQLSGGQPFMDANTARNALMRSNLPPQVLAQIWALSDLDKDGRLDIREYSIAMRLAFNCLAGMPLPPQLPPSLLVVPSRSTPVHLPPAMPRPPPAHPVMPQQPQQWMGSQTSIDQGTPERRMSQQHQQPFGASYPTAPAAIPAQRSMSISSTSGVPSPSNDRGVFEGRQLENWTIPHHNKLKYSQLFSSLDRDRVGFLNSQVARSALGLSGLSTPVLAHIWFLSDVNRDGKLSVDEYCISQFMIEMFKAGYAMPQVTPPELVRMCGISRSANNTPELEPGAEPPQKTPTLKTFEDKRHDNLVKGQAELERRRQILEEEENRRRAELEKKEREEQAKRERERQEKERQLELEREAELERQRILEQQREEAERQRRLELDKRKEEEEKQKKILAEKAKVKQMTSQKQQESERLAQRQQREKTLTFQLQALDEKSTDIEIDIGKAKEAVAEVTKGIEGMRSGRDDKVSKIKELQQENQKLAIESQEMGHQLLQMQGTHKETTSRKNELDNLRRKRDEIKKSIETAGIELGALKEKNHQLKEDYSKNEAKYNEDVYSKLLAKREEYRKVFELFVHAQTQAKSKLDLIKAKIESPVVNNSTNGFNESPFGASDPFASDPFASQTAGVPTNPKIPISESRNSVQSQIDSHETTKCRALFAFEARSEDELSFEPGDVIIVFQSHIGEPGWKAGQLRDKVGWFPEAFVESIANVPQHATEPPIQNMPPNVTPSCSLDKIPEEEALRKAEIAKAMGTNGTSSESPKPVICQCIAQFQWRARNEDDLSFAKGDTIDVIEKQEMKWRGRRSTGETGWFPKSYVKVIGSESNGGTPSETPIKTAQTPTSPQAAFASAQYDTVPSANSSLPQYDFVPNVEQGSSSTDDWYVATYDFDAVESTDLALRVGDRILVLEKNDDWWKGRCNGKEGIFPANYVEKTSPGNATVAPIAADPLVICHARAIVDFVASAPNQLGIKVGDLVKVREKSAAGWWEGEIERDGKSLAGWFPGEYVKVVDSNGSVPPSAKVSIAGTTTAIAMFDYDASQADEVSFKTGDIIVITNKTDAEWWTGYKHTDPSKTGLFPANYVQLQ